MFSRDGDKHDTTSNDRYMPSGEKSEGGGSRIGGCGVSKNNKSGLGSHIK